MNITTQIGTLPTLKLMDLTEDKQISYTVQWLIFGGIVLFGSQMDHIMLLGFQYLIM